MEYKLDVRKVAEDIAKGGVKFKILKGRAWGFSTFEKNEAAYFLEALDRVKRVKNMNMGGRKWKGQK